MIGVFGSAFNPPTRGHLDAITQALSVCEEILLVPSIAHAFQKQMIPFEGRLSLIEAFVSDIDDSRLKICRIEEELWDGEGSVFTVDVLQALQVQNPDKDFAFLCGPDNILALHLFERPQVILSQHHVFSLRDRTGIRSTMVRNAAYFDNPIGEMVTGSVLNIIKEQRLYEQ
jgi:nicotinate-nucleotide adenylyltransferase